MMVDGAARHRHFLAHDPSSSPSPSSSSMAGIGSGAGPSHTNHLPFRRMHRSVTEPHIPYPPPITTTKHDAGADDASASPEYVTSPTSAAADVIASRRLRQRSSNDQLLRSVSSHRLRLLHREHGGSLAGSVDAQPRLAPPLMAPPKEPKLATPINGAVTGAGYFEIYRPYKLNPALTPSLRSSRSRGSNKVDESADAAARQSKQAQAAALALPAKGDAVAAVAAVAAVPAVAAEAGRSEEQKRAQVRVPASPPVSPISATSRNRASFDSASAAQPQRLDAEASAKAGYDDMSSMKKERTAASVEAWRKMATEAANRNPSGYSSTRVVAGVTRRKSRPDLRASQSQSPDPEPPIPQLPALPMPATPPPAPPPPHTTPLTPPRAQRTSQLEHVPHSHSQSHAHSHSQPPIKERAVVPTATPDLPPSPANVDAANIYNEVTIRAPAPSSSSTISSPRRLRERREAMAQLPEGVAVPTIDEIVRSHSPALRSPIQPQVGVVTETPPTPAPAPAPNHLEVPASAPVPVPATYAASSQGMGRRAGTPSGLVKEPVLSIEEILRKYSAPGMGAAPTSRALSPVQRALSPRMPLDGFYDSTVAHRETSRHQREPSDARTYDDSDSDDSLDSVTREARETLHPSTRRRAKTVSTRDAAASKMSRTASGPSATPTSPRAPRPRILHHATSFPSRPTGFSRQDSPPPVPPIPRSTGMDDAESAAATRRPEPRSTTTPLPPSLRDRTSSMASSSSMPVSVNTLDRNDDASIASFVRSSRLTRVLTLGNPPNIDLKVSIADVGSPDGHPVFVFLGLGAVRYLVGLYDELASLFGLRLICIDRWGLGKTDDVPNERRGVLEWSSVVSEVADQLGVGRFSLLAHSAGAPYAMATVLLQRERICGPVHLLAPWVSPEIESGYKWLRYVPEPIIRTAQTAEWRLAGWRLGKAVEANDTDRKRSAATHVPASASAPPLSIRSGGGGGNAETSTIASGGDGSSAEVQSIASSTLQIHLPSPTTGLSANATASQNSVKTPMTPSKSKASFLGSFFGSRSTSAAQAAAVSSASPAISSDGEDWTGPGAMSPTIRQDEDGLVASRGDPTTDEAAGLDPDAGIESLRSPDPSPLLGSGSDSHSFPRSNSSGSVVQLTSADIEFPTSILRHGGVGVGAGAGADSMDSFMGSAARRRRVSSAVGRAETGAHGAAPAVTRTSSASDRDASSALGLRRGSTSTSGSSTGLGLGPAAAASVQNGSGSGSGSGRSYRRNSLAGSRRMSLEAAGRRILSVAGGGGGGGAGGAQNGVAAGSAGQPPRDAAAPRSAQQTADLATSLLRASHAESLRGSTSDLLTILGGRSGAVGGSGGAGNIAGNGVGAGAGLTTLSSSGISAPLASVQGPLGGGGSSSSSSGKAKSWGFTYADVRHPIKVWHGDKDERIGLAGVFWMERECPAGCEVHIVKGANHSLMTNTRVVIEALESLATFRELN